MRFLHQICLFWLNLAGIIVSSWVIMSCLKERTRGKVFEVIAMVTLELAVLPVSPHFLCISSFQTWCKFDWLAAGQSVSEGGCRGESGGGIAWFFGFLAAGLLASLCDFQDRFPLDSRHHPCG